MFLRPIEARMKCSEIRVDRGAERPQSFGISPYRPRCTLAPYAGYGLSPEDHRQPCDPPFRPPFRNNRDGPKKFLSDDGGNASVIRLIHRGGGESIGTGWLSMDYPLRPVSKSNRHVGRQRSRLKRRIAVRTADSQAHSDVIPANANLGFRILAFLAETTRQELT